MICILAEPGDTDALWLAAALLRRGERVEVVLPEELVVGSRLTYRLDTWGSTSLLVLHDGRRFGEGQPSLVVNRLADLPGARGVSSAVGAAYVVEEWRAAITAWLRALPCPVLNPPRAASVAGPLLPTAGWRSAAHEVGLRARPWHSGGEAPLRNALDVVTLGGLCFAGGSDVPEGLREPLGDLAACAGVPLLAARFSDDDGGWAFVDATSRPALSRCGPRLLDAVVQCARTGELPR